MNMVFLVVFRILMLLFVIVFVKVFLILSCRWVELLMFLVKKYDIEFVRFGGCVFFIEVLGFEECV